MYYFLEKNQELFLDSEEFCGQKLIGKNIDLSAHTRVCQLVRTHRCCFRGGGAGRGGRHFPLCHMHTLYLFFKTRFSVKD